MAFCEWLDRNLARMVWSVIALAGAVVVLAV